VLSADSHLEVRDGFSVPFDPDLDEFADSLLIQNLETDPGKDLFLT